MAAVGSSVEQVIVIADDDRLQGGRDSAMDSVQPCMTTQTARARWRSASSAFTRAQHDGTAPMNRPNKQSHDAASLDELAFNLSALLSPKQESFEGGQGVLRILEARDREPVGSSWLHDNKYWRTTLFAWTGRALPLKQWLLYLAYTVLVVVLVMLLVPNYHDNAELRSMEFPITALGTALFLLMAFRTNSCYERWWEGRRIWGCMGQRCLDMSRAAAGWIAPRDPHKACHIIRLIIVYSVVFKKWLRRQETELKELCAILPRDTVARLQQELHPVHAVTVMLTEAIDSVHELLPPAVAINLEAQLQGMINDAQGCMRIVQTPMPFAYVVHLRSFMVLWLMALPLAFVAIMGPFSILLSVVVAYQLLGFEDIGVEIEQPFGTDYNDLPVDQMAVQLARQLAKRIADIQERYMPAKGHAAAAAGGGDECA